MASIPVMRMAVDATRIGRRAAREMALARTFRRHLPHRLPCPLLPLCHRRQHLCRRQRQVRCLNRPQHQLRLQIRHLRLRAVGATGATRTLAAITPVAPEAQPATQIGPRLATPMVIARPLRRRQPHSQLRHQFPCLFRCQPQCQPQCQLQPLCLCQRRPRRQPRPHRAQSHRLAMLRVAIRPRRISATTVTTAAVPAKAGALGATCSSLPHAMMEPLRAIC